jgi:plasmid maintenance system antidote protein VapI
MSTYLRGMTLSEWIAREGLTKSAVAASLCMTRGALSNLCNGRFKPSLETAVAIERLTEGKVPPSSWLTAA